ncbi:MAG TPA: aminoglycoside phosphotransferase family protein [Casimicrobiaceae bacterium]|nr:aminoglycoside phosphotransferase family protein [Casimicrobiaceae bacterium]
MEIFEPWLARWRLVPDGAAFTTRFGSELLPVLSEGRPAILKIASGEEEIRGSDLLAWYGGDGAVSVFAREDAAILMERASGSGSLAAMVRAGQDDDATRILCRSAAALHAGRASPPPSSLLPLSTWYRALSRGAEQKGGVFARALPLANALLAQQQEIVPLHGDFHHENVLDAGPRGWLVIDPKGLIGERAFEFANLFRNPDAATALVPGRLRRQLALVSHEAHLDPRRLLEWIFTYSALGAVWSIDVGHDKDAATGIAIAELAESELNT